MIPGQVPDRRFRVALGLSILTHVLLAGGWGDGMAGAAAPRSLLQARLDGAPAVAADVLLPEMPAVAATPDLRSTDSRRPALSAQARTSAATSAGIDSRFYLARELDQYPAAPGLPEQGQLGAHVRVWVGIDQQGRVVDVAAADPGDPVADIRERLQAVRFVPARKDGRPVKSRVLMEWPER